MVDRQRGPGEVVDGSALGSSRGRSILTQRALRQRQKAQVRNAPAVAGGAGASARSVMLLEPEQDSAANAAPTAMVEARFLVTPSSGALRLYLCAEVRRPFRLFALFSGLDQTSHSTMTVAPALA